MLNFFVNHSILLVWNAEKFSVQSLFFIYHLRLCVRVCVCVCVCDREREKEKESVCKWVW